MAWKSAGGEVVEEPAEVALVPLDSAQRLVLAAPGEVFVN
jgi:hypothetical protein